MVSEQEIARGVVELLSVGNGGTTINTLNDVVHQLSAKLGLDLSDKAGFIAGQIQLLRRHLTSPPPPFLYGNDYFTPQHHHHLYYHHHQQSVFGGGSHMHHHQHQKHVGLSADVAPTSNKDNSTQIETKKRGGSGGLNKLCGVSPELQAIVGEATMSRTEIVRQLWVYIRKNNLQDPSNKRKIICDEALRVVLETDVTDMFQMNKLLSKHILPLGPSKDPVPSKRQKLDDKSGSLPADTVVAAVTAKSSENFDGASLVISDALAGFLGTSRKEMLVSEAIQHVFEYIKVNGLEDSSSLIVNCDEKLRELLGCERISMLDINETLIRNHLLHSS